MHSSSVSGSSGYSTRFKIVAPLLVLVALVLLVVAYQRAANSGDDPVLESGGGQDFVEELIPDRNSQVVQQTTIGIDLATGWEAALVLGSQEVPEDQVSVNQALNRVEFTPGPGTVLDALPAGRFCAQAIAWESAVGREAREHPVSWCFTVV
jgi:hypothetical protein